MAKNDSPLEAYEQRQFVKYLETKKLKFTAIPNSTWTSSFAVKNRNKAQGVRRGPPDLMIVIPASKSVFLEAKLLFVEMKRIKGGVLSPEQKEWNEALNEVENVGAYVCKGCEAAKVVLDRLCV